MPAVSTLLGEMALLERRKVNVRIDGPSTINAVHRPQRDELKPGNLVARRS